jgi:hypothetical protein
LVTASRRYQVVDVIVEAGDLVGERVVRREDVRQILTETEFDRVGALLVEEVLRVVAAEIVELLVAGRQTFGIGVGSEHREIVGDVVEHRDLRGIGNPGRTDVVGLGRGQRRGRRQLRPVDPHAADDRQPIVPDELVLGENAHPALIVFGMAARRRRIVPAALVVFPLQADRQIVLVCVADPLDRVFRLQLVIGVVDGRVEEAVIAHFLFRV